MLSASPSLEDREGQNIAQSPARIQESETHDRSRAPSSFHLTQEEHPLSDLTLQPSPTRASATNEELDEQLLLDSTLDHSPQLENDSSISNHIQMPASFVTSANGAMHFDGNETKSHESKFAKRLCQHWRPFTLRIPFLATLGVLMLFSIVFIEVLVQKSKPNYALAFQNWAEDKTFTPWTQFSCLYLPTILAIVFGILWAWLDGDVKRLEPFSQMIKAGGVSAHNSLHLNYANQNMYMVPWIAMKKRHLAVLSSSLATLLYALVITPLVSSLLSVKIVTESLPEPIVVYEDFDVTSLNNLTTEFAYSAFAWEFLDADLPEMMTDSVAVAPFQPLQTKSNSGDNLTVPTTVYWSKLDCNDASVVSFSANTSNSSTLAQETYFSDGQSWLADLPGEIFGLLESSGTIEPPHYGDWLYDVNVSNSLYPALLDSQNHCVGHSSPTFTSSEFILSVTQYTAHPAAEMFSIPPSMSHAVFCRPSYWMAPANVLASYTEGRSIILNWTITGSYQQLQFNSSCLNGLWVDGVTNEQGPLTSITPLQNLPIPSDYYDTDPLYKGEPSLIHPNAYSRGAWTNGLASWAFARANGDFVALSNPNSSSLVDALNSSMSTLFAFAMQSKLSHLSESSSPLITSGTRRFNRSAIVIDPTIARILEGGFGILIVCLVALVCTNSSSQKASRLQGDPSPLASLMSLMAESDDLLEQFRRLPVSKDLGIKIVEKAVPDDFQLFLDFDRKGNLSIKIEASPEGPADTPEVTSVQSRYESQPLINSFTTLSEAFRPPLELESRMGLTVLTLFLSMACSGSFLYWTDVRNGGLRVITDNRFAFQILFSYLPVLLGTATTSFWVTLSKTLMAVAPLRTMLSGVATSRRSISTNLSSKPPEVSLLEALSLRYWRLATVLVCTIMSSVLTVMLSGLFEEIYVPVTQTQGFTVVPPSVYQNRSFGGGSGPYYRLYAELALNSSVPSWTDRDYYFQPFQLNDTNTLSTNVTDQYRAITRGIGADLVCQPDIYNGSANLIDSEYLDGGSDPGQLDLLYNANILPVINGSYGGSFSQDEWMSWKVQCSAVETRVDLGSLRNSSEPKLQYRFVTAWPDWTPMQDYLPEPSDPSTNDCPLFLPYATLNVALSIQQGVRVTIEDKGQQSGVCRAYLTTGLFDTIVNPSGAVINATLLGNLTKDFIVTNSTAATWLKKINYQLQVRNSFFPTGEEGTRFLEPPDVGLLNAKNWVVLLSSYLNSSSLNPTTWTDGSVPPLSSTNADMAAFYRRVFAISAALDAHNTLSVIADWDIPDQKLRNTTLAGQATITAHRVRMSLPRFIVSIVILDMFLITLVVIYIRPMWRFLPFMPQTLAEKVLFTCSSTVLDDVRGTSNMTPKEREEHLRTLNHRYYIGWGGSGELEKRQFGLHKVVASVINQGSRFSDKYQRLIKRKWDRRRE